MTKSTAKVSDSGYIDVCRQGITVRVFLRVDYIIAMRPDKLVSDGIPYVPIIVRVNEANETPYQKYRDVVFGLMVDDANIEVFRTTGEFRNEFPKRDAESLKRIVSSLYKKHYSLKVMII